MGVIRDLVFQALSRITIYLSSSQNAAVFIRFFLLTAESSIKIAKKSTWAYTGNRWIRLKEYKGWWKLLEITGAANPIRLQFDCNLVKYGSGNRTLLKVVK